MEKLLEVKTYKVCKRCDKCQDGYMESTGTGVTIGWESSWSHKCDVCGATANFSTTYPGIRYEEIPTEISDVQSRPDNHPGRSK